MAIAGIGIFFAVISVIVQLAVVIYFFILFNRLIHTVERIERQSMEIESAIKTLH